MWTCFSEFFDKKIASLNLLPAVVLKVKLCHTKNEGDN